jgi:ATP-dependent RNA helicase HelY
MSTAPTPASEFSPAERYRSFRRKRTEDGAELADFQGLYDFPFDEFQSDACRALAGGHGVLVAAPTGSGKTVIGEFAVHLALARGGKCFYTTPIKALSNQKYNDLIRRYGQDRVGLLTGDNSINGEAAVVVMTTEVLRNMIYAGSPTLAGLSFVVLDEVHYLADRYRGAVWEEVIIHLPESVQVVALSATVSNAEEFGDWLSAVRGGTTVIVDEHRPVPLWQHMLVGARLYDLFVEEGGRGQAGAPRAQVNPELLRFARREEWTRGRVPGRPARGGHRPVRTRALGRPEVIERLDSAALLPAITFIFSRAGCDAAVRQCLDAGLRLTTPEESAAITEVAERRTSSIPEQDLAVLGYGEWLSGLQRGIAAHHAGMLPTFKEVVEELFTDGLIRAVFATETLSLGINMPARTVVIERLDKWDGETHADLTPGEYTQLTGRAGRRGIDVEGHAVVVWQPGMEPVAVASLAGTRTYRLNSSFQPSYNMAVNLVAEAGRGRAVAMLEASFAQFQADRSVSGISRQAEAVRKEQAALEVACDRGDFAEYAGLRRELSDLERDQSRFRSAVRRAEARASLEALRPGDIITVPGGRRAGVALVLEPGLPRLARRARPGAGGPRRARGRDDAGVPGSGPPGSGAATAEVDSVPAPLVLTADRQVRKLSLADFPSPATVIDRIKIPAWFSARSPKHRRDLAATMRTKIADHDLRKPSRRERDKGAQEAAGSEEVARLRRRLREHPCHSCPDREAHARQAERHARLESEARRLESTVAGRTHVLARTFERVCAVLGDLGYLAGDSVTESGRRLRALYTELDLLAAECLRRGLWDDLEPPELAACVSALTFEARRSDESGSTRLPGGGVREVLAEMVRVWEDLSRVEQDHGVSFLREPDAGLAWTAHAWARGKPLETVLGPDLTAGDFVRAMKQLIDLLGQLATAAAGTPLAKTARSAADALRRGVVAYSSVA